jgi:hypothetical protein
MSNYNSAELEKLQVQDEEHTDEARTPLLILTPQFMPEVHHTTEEGLSMIHNTDIKLSSQISKAVKNATACDRQFYVMKKRKQSEITSGQISRHGCQGNTEEVTITNVTALMRHKL